jgi:hypothetical protein
VTRAHVAVAVEHALVDQDAVGGHQVLDELGGRGSGRGGLGRGAPRPVEHRGQSEGGARHEAASGHGADTLCPPPLDATVNESPCRA